MLPGGSEDAVAASLDLYSSQYSPLLRADFEICRTVGRDLPAGRRTVRTRWLATGLPESQWSARTALAGTGHWRLPEAGRVRRRSSDCSDRIFVRSHGSGV